MQISGVRVDNFWSLLKGPDTTPCKPTLALTPAEIASLFRVALNPKHLCMLSLLYGASLRGSELLNLKGADFEKEGDLDIVVLRESKTSPYMRRSVAPWVMEAVRGWKAEVGPDELLFDVSYSALDKMFRRLLKKAGINRRLSVHSVRATGVTKLLDKGYSARYVMMYSGHKDVRTVMRYDGRRNQVTQNPGLTLDWREG